MEGASSVIVGCLQCFGWVLAVEGSAVFWRGVAFWEGACSVLEGCGIFGGRAVFWRDVKGCLQCFGGAWHFGGGASSCFGGVWHFRKVLAVLWRGVCNVLEEGLAVF